MPTYYDDAHARYITELFAPHDAILQHIYENISKRGLPAITITPEEGRFLQFLVRVCRARRAVEIGTLGGYSGTWLARGLPADGKLITLEKEPQRAAIAREHFALAGLSERVEVRVGDANELLPALSAEGPFDFCFIDADKLSYDAYLTWALTNVQPGGILAAHNAFRRGLVLDPQDKHPETLAVRAFTRRWAAERRLLGALYPAGDGTLIGIVDF